MRKKTTGTPTDTAAACAFLCSDDGAYITGEAMNGTLDMGEYLSATWTAKRRV